MKKIEQSAANWPELLEQKNREIQQLQTQIQWLTQQMMLMKSGKFGASSEKTVALMDQCSLFAKEEETAEPPTPTEEITYRRKKQKGKRETDFSNFPKEEIVYELPEDERACTACGHTMHPCGSMVLRRELKYIPAVYKVVEHIQTAYSCRHCEKTSDGVPMKKSSVPDGLIKGSGIASPSLVAHILANKYTLALPLYRQEQEFQRQGIQLSRQTMSNWAIYAHQHWFEEMFKCLQQVLLSHDILHADETTLQVLREKERTAKQKSYVWLYSTSGNSKTPVVLYDYTETRKGDCASTFLNGFSGKLHTDGYDGYHCKLPPEITVVGCWAHMRRKFTDAIKCLPASTKAQSPAQIGLAFCDELFAIDRFCAEENMSSEERYRVRQEKSLPIVEKFYQWVDQEYQTNPMPKTVYGMALTYAQNQKSWLMNVFLDGRLELSNNRAERSIRPFAVGRKNWLFCNTPKGASASAAIYSLVETAKMNGLNPFAYLKFLLENLPNGTPPSHCLPWLDGVKLSCT